MSSTRITDSPPSQITRNDLASSGLRQKSFSFVYNYTITSSVHKYNARFRSKRAKAGRDSSKAYWGRKRPLPDSPLQHRGYPKQQVCPDFILVDFVEHLMSSARIEMMRDVRETCATIATHEDPKALQLLAHRVVAAGKEVNGQCAPYRSKAAGIGQLRSGGQEGLHRGRLECSEAQRVAHESVCHVGIAAQPIE